MGYPELSVKAIFQRTFASKLQFKPQDTLFNNNTFLGALKIGSLFIKFAKVKEINCNFKNKRFVSTGDAFELLKKYNTIIP